MRIRVNKLFSRYRKLVLRLKEDFHFSKWQNSGFRVCFSFSSNCVCASVSNRVSQKNQKSEFCFATKPTGFHRLDEPPEKISALQTHKRHSAINFACPNMYPNMHIWHIWPYLAYLGACLCFCCETKFGLLVFLGHPNGYTALKYTACSIERTIEQLSCNTGKRAIIVTIIRRLQICSGVAVQSISVCTMLRE